MIAQLSLNLCAWYKAEVQAQLNRKQAEDLRREKQDLEKRMSVTQQKAAEVNAW